MSSISAIETQADLLIRGAPPPNDHFLNPQPLPKMPFEMKYAERRLHSRDPRIRKQLADELQFENTIVSGIWNNILSKYALTLNERWIDVVEFEKMLLSLGITNDRIRGKVCEVFFHESHQHNSVTVIPSSVTIGHHSFIHDTRRWNTVVLCQQLALLLSDPERQDDYIGACFDRFDRPDPTMDRDKQYLDKHQLLHTELAPPPDPVREPIQTFRWFDTVVPPEETKQFKGSSNPKMQKQIDAFLLKQRMKQLEESTFVLPDIPLPQKRRRRKKGSGPELPAAMRAGATYDQLEPLKGMLLTGAAGNEFLSKVYYKDFKEAFLDPANTDWVASFLGTIFEVAASLCLPPNGVAPLPPMRWVERTLEAVPRSQHQMADADILLLGQLEQNGGSATDPVEKKRKKPRANSSSSGGDVSSSTNNINNNGSGSSGATSGGARSGPTSGRRGSNSRKTGGAAEDDLLAREKAPLGGLGYGLLSLANSLDGGKGNTGTSAALLLAAKRATTSNDDSSTTFLTTVPGSAPAPAAAAVGSTTGILPPIGRPSSATKDDPNNNNNNNTNTASSSVSSGLPRRTVRFASGE